MADEQTLSHHMAHIPQGVADYFWQEAGARRALEGELLALFRRWGYGDVIPPMFEFADVLSARASAELQAEMYRFLDRDGSTLALRPDMTIAVARLLATRLHDWPMPQRFCYAGSVFRYTELQAARQREFCQAGIELFGAAAPAADAEVLTVTARALTCCGLNTFRLVLGQMAYFHGLLDDLALTPGARAMLLTAIDHNSEAELAEFLRSTPLRTQQRHTVEGLLGLNGADASAIIDRADRLCLNYRMHGALENLRAICTALAAQGVDEHLFIDLTEISNLGYYTGLTFEALTPELGFAVASGGRYDNLVGSFGAAQPAVGAALELDRILLARAVSHPTEQARRPVASHLLVNPQGSATCCALLESWRARGVHITVEVNDRCGSDLWQAAQAQGIPAALEWNGHGFAAHDADNPTAVDLDVAAADTFVQRHAPARPSNSLPSIVETSVA